jgi:hypothetical protein
MDLHDGGQTGSREQQSMDLHDGEQTGSREQLSMDLHAPQTAGVWTVLWRAAF